MDKICFKCRLSKPIEEFYAHPLMTDGHLGKCKECTRLDSRRSRNRRLQYYRQYDLRRAAHPARKAAVAAFQRSESQRAKKAARSTLGHALAAGRVVKGPCARCGTRINVQAHHHDYSKPLDVTWECRECHFGEHRKYDLAGLPIRRSGDGSE